MLNKETAERVIDSFPNDVSMDEIIHALSVNVKFSLGKRASLFVSRLFDATDRLQEPPSPGRIIPDIDNPDCREALYGTCRIMYRIEGNEVWVTGDTHGARNGKPE